MRPNEQDVIDALGFWERAAMHARGVGWALLMLFVLAISAVISLSALYALYLAVKWSLGHMYEYPRIADAANFVASGLIMRSFWE